MEPLKEMFAQAYYHLLADAISKVYPAFRTKAFLKAAMHGLEERSLNERLHHTAETLGAFLPQEFPAAADILTKAAPLLPKGYTALVSPAFVALYGQAHFDRSMEALKYFTTFGSSEFAIRVFLRNDLKRTLKVMEKWAGDKDHHVRRLASEGCRPRLPWSFKLQAVIDDPSLTTGILEKLKADPELYVRKSVANHLNDYSKDHPAYLLRLLKGWDASDPRTAWIIKHASRSLIKKGDADSLALFAFEADVKVKTDLFLIKPGKLRIGESSALTLQLTSEKRQPQKLVIDYAVHYIKSSGQPSKKVFKWKEATLPAGATLTLHKRHAFKDLSTRKHFAGKHLVEVMVNGKVAAKEVILLTASS
ncbi:DNA alkylation repair protein [Chitinophaga lutea]